AAHARSLAVTGQLRGRALTGIDNTRSSWRGGYLRAEREGAANPSDDSRNSFTLDGPGQRAARHADVFRTLSARVGHHVLDTGVVVEPVHRQGPPVARRFRTAVRQHG